MANSRRIALVSIAAAAALAVATGCTPTSTPTPTPSSSITTPTPTPTPTSTYGPNQTAAMATVTAYYDWINKASKDPLKRDMTQLNKLADGEGLSYGVTSTGLLLQKQQHQVGDLVIAQMIPDAEQTSQIGVTVCIDASNAVRVDSAGQVVQPADGLTRRVHSLTVKAVNGHWLVVGNKGGNTSC